MAVALSQFAIIDEAAIKLGGSFGPGTDQDDFVRTLCNQATGIVETYLRRRLITRDVVEEFHTMRCGDAELLTRDYPIIEVQDVAEDLARVYSTLLATSDYQVVPAVGKLYRLSGGYPFAWLRGFRAIRIRYSYGYAGISEVPEEIKEVAVRWALLAYKETQSKRQGVASITDSTGTTTRFYSTRLSDDMKAQLYPHRRQDYAQTGERDE